MMDAAIFAEKGYYFNQTLKLIVFCYQKLKEDRLKEPYSIDAIGKKAKTVRQSTKEHKEVEDYLRNDLVKHYLQKHRQVFSLGQFSIQPGSEEIVENIKIGIVDIRFACISAGELLDSTDFIFECKRLNHSAKYIHAYIDEGMNRFIRKQYYGESNMTKAGMIAFIETDYKKKRKEFLPIDAIVDKLKIAIETAKDQLKSTAPFLIYPLTDDTIKEITHFKTSYLSTHLRDKDNADFSIHHLLLDYRDILQP